jgi:hypothetical protein
MNGGLREGAGVFLNNFVTQEHDCNMNGEGTGFEKLST